MSESPMLTYAISKIATQQAGGWKITLDVPEIMGPVVKQLIGTENKTLYRSPFEKIGEIEIPEKRGPGRPKYDSEDNSTPNS